MTKGIIHKFERLFVLSLLVKVIIIYYEAASYQMLLSIAALMIALSVGYFLLKRAIESSASEEFGDDSEHTP